jgi:hypothetical protein
MGDGKSCLKSGNSVCIKQGIFTGHIGEVIDILTLQTRLGPAELVWVKLGGGRIDGFSPESLEKLGGFQKRCAA